MAVTNRLNMVFNDNGGDKLRIGLNHADENVQDATVKALMGGIITNNVIFESVPVSIVSAELVTTTKTELDVTE